VRLGKPRFVLPLQIGKVEICDGIENGEILSALAACADH
jgi:hypothetical protein